MNNYVRNQLPTKSVKFIGLRKNGYIFANKKEKEKAEKLCGQMFSDKSIPNIDHDELTKLDKLERLQNKISYFYKPYTKRGDNGVPVLLKFNQDHYQTSNIQEAKQKWKELSGKVLGKDSEKFRTFLKSVNMSIDSYSHWAGDKYCDKTSEARLNPDGYLMQRTLAEVSARGSKESIRSGSIKSKAEQKRLSLKTNLNKVEWREAEALNTKTCSTRKSSSDEIMPFFPFSTLINSGNLKKTYFKMLKIRNRSINSKSHMIAGKVSQIRSTKSTGRRWLSVYMQSAKKAKPAHKLSESVWFKNYSTKSVQLQQKINGWGNVLRSVGQPKQRKSVKKTVELLIDEYDDSALSVSNESA